MSTDSDRADALIAEVYGEQPLVVELAELASPAVRLEPGLLRRLRHQLLPNADPCVEADLWFGPLIAAHEPGACVLHDAVSVRLRERLAADPARLAGAAAIVQAVHQGLPAAIRAEEALTLAALANEPALDEQVERILQPALHAIASADEGHALEAARWALQASARLHHRIHAAPAVQALLIGAAVRLEAPQLPASVQRSSLPADALSWLLPSSPTRGRVQLHPTLLSGGLRFDPAATDESHNVELPHTRPLLVSLHWTSAGTARNRLVAVEVGAIVQLEGDPGEVEIVTLAGGRYRLAADASEAGSRSEATASGAEVEAQAEATMQAAMAAAQQASASARSASTPAQQTSARTASSRVVETALRSWEKRQVPEPGLYRLDAEKGFELSALQSDRPASEQPTLLLVHDIASNTRASFAELGSEQNGAARHALSSSFAHRAWLAFEHRTLSIDPIENALNLARALPAGARLRLLTLGTGGLIGELLCRVTRVDGVAPFDAADNALFTSSPEAQAILAELSSTLAAKRLHIERFVRVACPARGLPLPRLRALAKLMGLGSRVLSILPGLRSASLIADALSVLAEPELAPGLASVEPAAPLIAMLNRPEVAIAADLSVVAGIHQADTLFEKLTGLLVDTALGDQNDLLVSTASMYGGAPRPRGAYVARFQGAQTHHFSYFSTPAVVQAIVDRLTGDSVQSPWTTLSDFNSTRSAA